MLILTLPDALPSKAANGRKIIRLLIGFYPAWIACLLLGMILINTYFRATFLNNGRFIYALDDTYIHMSIARNFAEHGVWGTTQYHYTSATSSPLWTLTLSLLYGLFGTHENTPLILNVLFALALLVTVNEILRRMHTPSLFILAAELGLVYLLPLESLIFSGMEHILHMLLMVAFVYHAAKLVCQQERLKLESWDTGLLLILGTAVFFTRYESGAVVLFFCILFALRRRVMIGFMLGVFSIMPVIVYGTIAINQGWNFFPTSILLNSPEIFVGNPQGKFIDYVTFDGWLLEMIRSDTVKWVTLLTLAVLYVVRSTERRAFWETGLVMLMAAALVITIHVRFVFWPGNLFRYETYVLCLAWVAVFVGVGRYLPSFPRVAEVPRYLAAALVVFFVLSPWIERLDDLNERYPIDKSMHSIYLQQYHMADFLRTFYEGQGVVANDIGAINYFADIRNIDLWGLGTWEMARARWKKYLHPAVVDGIVTQYNGKIAVIYNTWFKGEGWSHIPDNWVEVGSWSVENLYILGDEVVSFYAIDPAEVDILKENLWIYSASLPSDVFESGDYLKRGEADE